MPSFLLQNLLLLGIPKFHWRMQPAEPGNVSLHERTGLLYLELFEVSKKVVYLTK